MQLECGPDLSADQQASQLQQCRGQHEAAPVQPADQKQQPGTLCAALQQLSDGSEPAMNGDMTSEEAAGGAKGGSAAPAAHAAPPQQQQLLPGEVGWFQVKGYPHWPFLVVTREEAAARGVPGQGARAGTKEVWLHLGRSVPGACAAWSAACSASLSCRSDRLRLARHS